MPELKINNSDLAKNIALISASARSMTNDLKAFETNENVVKILSLEAKAKLHVAKVLVEEVEILLNEAISLLEKAVKNEY